MHRPVDYSLFCALCPYSVLCLCTAATDMLSKAPCQQLLTYAVDDPLLTADGLVQQLIVESVRLSAAKAMHDPVGLQQYFQARLSECKILTQQEEPPPDMWPGILVTSIPDHSA